MAGVTLVPRLSILTHGVRPINVPPLSAYLKHSSRCMIILVQYDCWMLIGSPFAAVYSPFKGLLYNSPQFQKDDVEIEREGFLLHNFLLLQVATPTGFHWTCVEADLYFCVTSTA